MTAFSLGGSVQNLSGSVGEKGTNAVHDVALVQAILVLAKRPASVDPKTPQYLTSYDGGYGKKTKEAIENFQSDFVFVGPDGKSCEAVANATLGLISPGDATWTKLALAPPASLRDLRVLTSSKTVYVPGTVQELLASRLAVANATFEPGFRVKVVNLINRLYDCYGLVASVSRDGSRRTFQTQYDLLTSGREVTKAGPGESNHNFGQAVDLGFKDLRWLKCDGSVVAGETSWFHKLDAYKPLANQSMKFWDVLRAERTYAGLFRGPIADRPHLQAWDDHGIDMADRLADLLTRTGMMCWTGRAQRYKCDLGYGGAHYDVGTAAEIWTANATVSAATIALASKRKATAVTADDVCDMQLRLQQDFQTADANWQAWRSK